MSHRIIVSKYRRNGRDEVLVIRDADEQEVMHLHPDHNAVDGEAWAKIKDSPLVAKLLANGQLVDKGDAPEPKAPAAPAKTPAQASTPGPGAPGAALDETTTEAPPTAEGKGPGQASDK